MGITASQFRLVMAAAYREMTGFEPEPASDLGVRFSVLAQVLEGLSDRVEQAARDAFPQTATGEGLELLAASRGLSRRPAVHSVGQVRFSRNTPAPADILVPAGTRALGTAGVQVISTAPATIAAGRTEIMAPATAAQPGKCGNLPAFSLSALLTPVAGVTTAFNSVPFTGGADSEDDSSLRIRLMAAMADPPNSFNLAFYRQAALSFPGVGGVQVIPMARHPGSVDVHITTLPGFNQSSVSEGLRGVLSQTREIGTDIMVAPATRREINIVCLVRAGRGSPPAQALLAVRQAAADLFAGLRVGEGVSLSRIHGALSAAPGVDNIRLMLPGVDIPAAPGQQLEIRELEVREDSSGLVEVGAR